MSQFITDTLIDVNDLAVLSNTDNGCDSIYYKGKWIRDCDGACELNVFRGVQHYSFSLRMAGENITPDTLAGVIAEVTRQSTIREEAEQLQRDINEKTRILNAYKQAYGLG